MASKMTTDQTKRTRSLVAGIRKFASRAGSFVERFWDSILEEGQSLPETWEGYVLLLGRWLERNADDEAAADKVLGWGLQDRHKMVIDCSRWIESMNSNSGSMVVSRGKSSQLWRKCSSESLDLNSLLKPLEKRA